MQLGELQHQLPRFIKRGATVLGLSVDLPRESAAMVERMGLQFELGSDRDQSVINAFRVQNPTTQQLALHAVYIVDRTGKIFYRKVARRRPGANELIDAIDAYRGVYPQGDRVAGRNGIKVAYPDNNFQALLEVTRNPELPQAIDQQAFALVRQAATQIHNDDAIITYRDFMLRVDAPLDSMLEAAAWLARVTYFESESNALRYGQILDEGLRRVAELEERLDHNLTADLKDQLLTELTQARAELTRTRAIISNHAAEWRLRLLKTSIRSYREVARAAYRERVGTNMD